MNVQWDSAKIAAEIQRRALRALRAGAITLVNRTKQLASVPAPRRRVVSRKGVAYYRARTAAIAGAPPRKLSGRLRASLTYQVDPVVLSARVGTNVIYGRRLERQGHVYLSRALREGVAEIAAVMLAALGTVP